MHVLPSPFPWTSVCTLRISFSSPRPLTWNDSLFLSSFRGWHTAESACVCLWGFTSVLRSHAALELSRESTNIQMLIKQKKKRLGPGVCGCAADRRTHPRSAPSQSHIYHLSRSRRGLGASRPSLRYSEQTHILLTACARQVKSTWSTFRRQFTSVM